MRFLPSSATPTAKLVLITRGMRSLADGCVSVLLPAYLLGLGFDALQVGLLTTATLSGSALLTLAAGLYESRASIRTVATGIGFAAPLDVQRLMISLRTPYTLPYCGTLQPPSDTLPPAL